MNPFARSDQRQLSVAVIVSLLFHAIFLTLSLGGRGSGLPGWDLPWRERRAEATPLRVLLGAGSAPGAAAAPTLQSAPARVVDPPAPPLQTMAARRPSPETLPALEPVPMPRTDTAPALPAEAAPLPSLAAEARLQAPETRKPIPTEPVIPIAPSASSLERVLPSTLADIEAPKPPIEAPVPREQVQAAAQAEAERQAAVRQEAERQEAVRRAEVARQEQARQELAQLEAARADIARQQTARQEAARQEALRQEAARQEAVRQEAARQEAARAEAERQAAVRQEAVRAKAAQEAAETERREAARRAMGRQLDEEAARRDLAARTPAGLPSSWSSARRGRLFGRSDANAELVFYAEAWARKIQLNLAPEKVREAASRPHVHPMVTVALRRDGTVESVTFVVSSGVPEIDEAVRQIIQGQAPYPAFSPALAQDYDVIEIRRTWHFDSAVRLY